EMRIISARSAAQNLTHFLTPDDPHSVSGPRTFTSTNSTSNAASFVRPDGLGPGAEPESTFGSRGPGILPPELVDQLEQAGALATDDEVAAVHATRLDADTQEGAVQFINETLDLALHLQQSTLSPGVKSQWDGCKRHFLTFWRCLNRIRAQQHSREGASSSSQNDLGLDHDLANNSISIRPDEELEEILVSEQKLVTYLNCYVLHKNPRLGDEAINTHIKAVTNLWETQSLSGRNTNPHPRNGALLKAFLKAIRRGRSSLAAARQDDAWRHTLKDGYSEEEFAKVSRWYLSQAASESPMDWTSTVWRARFDFLMQHAIMGRSEDLRNTKLATMYMHKVPQSRPHPCDAVIVTIRHSKTNLESRKQFGVAARHRGVELCPVGALALFFFERFHVKKEAFPDLSSRATWYSTPLLVDDEDSAGVTWKDQAEVLRDAFNTLGIASSKLTHAMRGGGARLAHEAGCSEASIRIHGRWTAGGDQLIERYLTGIAVTPVRALAGFSAEGGDYYLPRTLLEPPPSLSDQLWPQATREEAKVRERHASGGEIDHAALSFLELIKWLESPEFSHFSKTLITTIQNTANPIEVTVSQLVPRLGHALADLRVATSENAIAIKQVGAETAAAINRLQSSLESAVADLAAAVEERSRKDNGQAVAQQILSASICALANASTSLQAQGTPAFPLETVLPLLEHQVPSPPHAGPGRPSALGEVSSLGSAAEVLSLVSPQQSSHQQSSHPCTTHTSASAPTAHSGHSASPGISSPALTSALPASSMITAAQGVAQSFPSLLSLAKEVNTVAQLAGVWYKGSNGQLGVEGRLELKDAMLDLKGAAARKQLCRWRRVIAVLDQAEAVYGRAGAVSRMDKLLKSDGFGLRTLSDNYLAKEEMREKWVVRLGT
ncbi:hypothetical protein CF326_g6910, partial [Tilletia indica]